MYSLIIPPELLGDLVKLREKFGKSIRSMILEAIRKYIDEMKGRVITAPFRKRKIYKIVRRFNKNGE